MSKLRSRHQLREDAAFRAGVRLIVAGVVVVSTWLGVTLAWFVTFPPLFGGGTGMRSIPHAIALAGGTVAAGCALALVIGLLAEARWRRNVLAAWTMASLVTAAGIATSDNLAGSRLLLLGVAVLVVGGVWWTLGTIDTPAGIAADRV